MLDFSGGLLPVVTRTKIVMLPCCAAQVEEYETAGSAERLREAGTKLEASRARMAAHEQSAKVLDSVAFQGTYWCFPASERALCREACWLSDRTPAVSACSSGGACQQSQPTCTWQ